MNALKNRDIEGVLITESQACCLINSGRTKVRKIAEEAGAVRRLGGNYRIHREKFLNHIEQKYSC